MIKKILLTISLLFMLGIQYNVYSYELEDEKKELNFGKLFMSELFNKINYNYSIKKDYTTFLNKLNEYKNDFQERIKSEKEKLKNTQLSSNYFLNQQIEEIEKRYNNLFKLKKKDIKIKAIKKKIKIKYNSKKIKKNKKIIEIEQQLSTADYVVYFGLDLNKFLIKPSENGTTYLIKYNDNQDFLDISNTENQKIIDEINSDLMNIKNAATYEDFKEELNKYKKDGKRYDQLFEVYELNNFLSKIKLGISYRGGQYADIDLEKQGIDFKYYNNIFFQNSEILNKLEEKGYNEFWLIIPLHYNDNIKDILRVNDAKTVFKYPAKSTLFLNIRYDRTNKDNIYLNSIINLYKKQLPLSVRKKYKDDKLKLKKINNIYNAKVVLGDFYSLKTNYISIKEEPWRSIIYLIIAALIGYYLGRYVIIKILNKLNEINKYEKEQV